MQKTNFKTRLLALLTAVFMVIMCVPFAAFADDAVMTINYYVDGKPVASDSFKQEYGAWALRDTFEDDSVIPKGKELTGWVPLSDSGVTLKLHTNYSWDDLSKYAQGGTLTLDAVFESEAPATQDVEITYYDFKNSVSAGSKKITVAADKTALTVEEVTANLPDNYKLENASAEFAILNGYCNVAVLPEDKPTTQNVGLVYYDFTNKVKALEKEVTVSADKTSFTAEEVKAYLPDGYELEDATKTSFDIAGGYVSIPVVKKAVPTTKTIKINYYSEEENKQISEVKMEVAADATYVNSGSLKAPDGYELVESGDFTIRDGYVYAAVRKVKAPATTKTIKINYYSEAEEKQISEVKMEVAADATYVNSGSLKAPDGYELVLSGDLAIRDGYVYAAVKKIGSKTVKINYYSEAEEKQIAEVEMTVAADATYVNTSELTAPEGYKLVLSGDLAIRDGYVYAAVNKIGSKTVKINYYSEAEEKQIKEEELTVAPDATCVNTSKLTAPTGYELVEVGDLPIRDGYVYAAVRKVSTKEVKINFYCPEEKKQVAEPTVVVNADATCVNSSAYAALVPAGYELAEVGDMPIRDGYVYAEVRKVATKTIKINYYSEEEEKQIAEVEMTVPADATYVNTSKLTAPAGYELVLAGDLPIRDGYVYAAVRKVPTTTIKISYVDEATDKEVGTEDLVVNQGTTVVNFNVLKSVPAGYELCEVGDFYVGNGSAKVMVRKTKTNNGSSSSSASSSSNTTNTSASQKQVVKAAAAPANTTKVLPKTGATNAAPLIGGSLAVVALLMGYGVYGLVLRKKD